VHKTEVTSAVETLFRGPWRRLHAQNWDLSDQLQYPGVYLLAYSDNALDGHPINVGDVYYVGMSTAAGGVWQRLKQFKSALEIGKGHSAGNRYYRSNGCAPFSEYVSAKTFYFTALCIPCESRKTTAKANDFRKMGQVACIEYYAIAHVLENGKKVPPLNKSAGGSIVEVADEQIDSDE
jgi:hypothetical protein